MYTFIIAIIALILGFFFYFSFVERTFGIEAARETPAYRLQDGVDYIPMPTWRVYLIQFLNIAGTGPIFGAIMGILFGPAAYLWIVFGCIFMGAVHDYLCGMISLRQDGASLPEMVGNELGGTARLGMRVLSLVLLVLVGTVFVTTAAGLLAAMTTGAWSLDSATWKWIWIGLVFLYCVLATLLPIDTLIGRLYPVFGAALLIMAVGVGIGLFTQNGWMPEITNHPFTIPLPLHHHRLRRHQRLPRHTVAAHVALYPERAPRTSGLLRCHDHRGHRGYDMGRCRYQVRRRGCGAQPLC